MSTLTALWVIWGIAGLEGCCAALIWRLRSPGQRDQSREAELKALQAVREIDRLRANTWLRLIEAAREEGRRPPPSV